MSIQPPITTTMALTILLVMIVISLGYRGRVSVEVMFWFVEFLKIIPKIAKRGRIYVHFRFSILFFLVKLSASF